MNGVIDERCSTLLERTPAVAAANKEGVKSVTFARTTRRFAIDGSVETPSQPHFSEPNSASFPVPGPDKHTRVSFGNSGNASVSTSDTSTVATDLRIVSGSSGWLKNECSRKRSIFCDRSTAKTWSRGQINGNANCDPGKRPKCGNHTRSRPHKMGGAMTTLPKLDATATAVRNCAS